MSDFVHIRLLCFDGVVCGMEERELLFACEMVDQDGAIPLIHSLPKAEMFFKFREMRKAKV